MKILNKYYVIVLTAIIFLCCSTTCETEPTELEYFTIENNSSDTIFIAHTWYYDDSEFNVRDVFMYEKPLFAIPPNKSRNDFYLGIPGDEVNKPFRYKNKDYTVEEGTHHIIIYKKETLEKHSKKELIEKNIYDEKYVLSLRDILDMNYKVSYPKNNSDNSDE